MKTLKPASFKQAGCIVSTILLSSCVIGPPEIIIPPQGLATGDSAIEENCHNITNGTLANEAYSQPNIIPNSGSEGAVGAQMGVMVGNALANRYARAEAYQQCLYANGYLKVYLEDNERQEYMRLRNESERIAFYNRMREVHPGKKLIINQDRLLEKPKPTQN